ncbi:MAG TPA: hypothetical protein PLX50_03695 [Candidatus Aminicenantes bacterium]|nr:hypothetical protein [Acidobacteriota bacterium]HOI44698.1 hypothetical protein [Candidatus Aminicenantes bacterium]
MRKFAVIAVLALFLPCSGILSQDQTPPSETVEPKTRETGEVPEPGFRDFPVQKPRYDYMSTFLSRSTNPLGLKEDHITRELLKQPGTKWALRAGARNILN